MNSKHRKVLEAIFAEPVSGTIEWASVERLMIAAGCDLIKGKGSAIRFVKNGVVGRFHRPHPGKEARKYQIRNARVYLTKIGITP